MNRLTSTIAAVVAAITVLTTANSHADVIINVPADFPHIQAAINHLTNFGVGYRAVEADYDEPKFINVAAGHVEPYANTQFGHINFEGSQAGLGSYWAGRFVRNLTINGNGAVINGHIHIQGGLPGDAFPGPYDYRGITLNDLVINEGVFNDTALKMTWVNDWTVKNCDIFTLLPQNNAAPTVKLDGQDISYSAGHQFINNTIQGHFGIDIIQTQDCLFSGNTITTGDQWGTQIRGDSFNTEYDDNEFNSWNAIRVESADARITNNDIVGRHPDLFTVDGDVGVQTAGGNNALIQGNTFTGIRKPITFLGGAYAQNWDIIGNTFSGGSQGILLQVHTSAEIRGNTFVGQTVDRVIDIFTATSPKTIIVDGNTISGWSGNDTMIRTLGVGTHQYTNNTLIGAGAGAPGFGGNSAIDDTTEGSSITVSGNRICNVNNAIRTGQQTQSITNNLIDNCFQGVLSFGGGSSTVLIDHNTFFNTAQSAAIQGQAAGDNITGTNNITVAADIGDFGGITGIFTNNFLEFNSPFNAGFVSSVNFSSQNPNDADYLFLTCNTPAAILTGDTGGSFQGALPVLNGGGDADNDNILDNCDNCPNIANPGQEDCDGDTIGDVCDPLPGTCVCSEIADELLNDLCDLFAADPPSSSQGFSATVDAAIQAALDACTCIAAEEPGGGSKAACEAYIRSLLP